MARCYIALMDNDLRVQRHTTQIIGADILQTKDPYKTFALLKEHVDFIRMHNPEHTASQVCIIVERNLGFEAEHLYRECQNTIENSCYMYEPGAERIGVLTTHARKIAYVSVMNNMLRDNRIYAASTTTWVEHEKNNSRSQLLDQLRFFGFSFSHTENAFQKEKMAISGKSSGGKDDLCMALLIGLFFVHENRYLTR